MACAPSQNEMRSHGLHSTYELHIEVDTAAERSSGNVAVLEHLQECGVQLLKARGALRRWRAMVSKAGGEEAAQLLGRIHTTAGEIDAVLTTAAEVGVPLTSGDVMAAKEDSFDDDDGCAGSSEEDELEWEGDGMYIDLDDVVRQLEGGGDGGRSLGISEEPRQRETLAASGMVEADDMVEVVEVVEVAAAGPPVALQRPRMQGRKRGFQNGQSLPVACEEAEPPATKRSRRS